MRLPGLLLLLLVSVSTGGLTADASITIQNPKMEQYRSVVEAAGIEDWPVAYRGHTIHVYATYTVTTLKGNSSECRGAAGPPSIGYTLVYDSSQFWLDENMTEYRVNVTSTNTSWIVTAELRAILIVLHNASVFEIEDETGNYTREQVYVVWEITRYYYVEDNGTCEVDSSTTRVRDYPEPRFMRLYARQPSYGLDSTALVVPVNATPLPGEPCGWYNYTVNYTVDNWQALGVPGPGDDEWGSIMPLRPGQLRIEGATLLVVLQGLVSGNTTASMVWSGVISAGEPLSFNITVNDTGVDRSMLVNASLTAIWDDPEGPYTAPVSVGNTSVAPNLTWVILQDAPGIVELSSRAGGPVYTVEPGGRVCVPPGSYLASCSGCRDTWVHVDEPVLLSMQLAAGGLTPPAGQAPGTGFWLLLGLLALLLLAGWRLVEWI